MEKDIAISVKNISKTFRIPHEKVSSLRGAAISAFSRNKGYEEFKALDDVSFEVKKGEFFGIIGRNGSGKSTLLKILAGIYQPDDVYPVKSRLLSGAKHLTGGVEINGRISPFLELGIGFNPELSGRDNVYLNATVLGLTKKEIDKKFDSIVQFSELERFIDQKLKNYSSGMQVRLAFSVSIHANREILLMDEVLAVGDNNFQSKCLTEFNRYKEMGKTVVLVTHDTGTVQKFCDRAMLVRNGSIIKIGKPDEVVSEYMFNNISDEESRLLKKEQNVVKSRNANKSVEILRVDFLDECGNSKNIFETGDNVSVRVYFEVHKMQEEFNFGLALFNQENDYIIGISTLSDEVDIGECIKKGYFQVDFKNVPLSGNAYYVSASIVKDSFILPYDIFPKSQHFKIISKNNNDGIINMRYDWK